MRGFLSFSTLAIKSITLVSTHAFIRISLTRFQPLVIASGLSVGKEGPSVHMACCIGNLVAGLFTRFSRSQGLSRPLTPSPR